MRYDKKIFLLVESDTANTNPLNHDKTLISTSIYANVNDLGIDRQLEIFNGIYPQSKIIRVRGYQVADYIAFYDYDEDLQKPKYSVTATKTHKNVTDFYILGDKTKEVKNHVEP